MYFKRLPVLLGQVLVSHQPLMRPAAVGPPGLLCGAQTRSFLVLTCQPLRFLATATRGWAQRWVSNRSTVQSCRCLVETCCQLGSLLHPHIVKSCQEPTLDQLVHSVDWWLVRQGRYGIGRVASLNHNVYTLAQRAPGAELIRCHPHCIICQVDPLRL